MADKELWGARVELRANHYVCSRLLKGKNALVACPTHVIATWEVQT